MVFGFTSTGISLPDIEKYDSQYVSFVHINPGRLGYISLVILRTLHNEVSEGQGRRYNIPERQVKGYARKNIVENRPVPIILFLRLLQLKLLKSSSLTLKELLFYSVNVSSNKENLIEKSRD